MKLKFIKEQRRKDVVFKLNGFYILFVKGINCRMKGCEWPKDHREWSTSFSKRQTCLRTKWFIEELLEILRGVSEFFSTQLCPDQCVPHI